MYIEIVQSWDMSRRWESNWMQFRVEETYPTGNGYWEASCLEFVWMGVVGFPGGKIQFLVSNNQKSSKILKEFEIVSASNIGNALYLNIFYPSFLYYKIIFEPNGISSGSLTVGALYR